MFTGLSSPVCLAPGDWKVARTRRLENLRYEVNRRPAPVFGFIFFCDFQSLKTKNPVCCQTGFVIKSGQNYLRLRRRKASNETMPKPARVSVPGSGVTATPNGCNPALPKVGGVLVLSTPAV